MNRVLISLPSKCPNVYFQGTKQDKITHYYNFSTSYVPSFFNLHQNYHFFENTNLGARADKITCYLLVLLLLITQKKIICIKHITLYSKTKYNTRDMGVVIFVKTQNKCIRGV